MTKYLLDTNICVFYLRGRFDIDLAAHEKIRLRLAGTPCDDNFDLLIACTAIANDMVCVADNTKDFHRFEGILLEDWVNRENK